MPIHSEELPWVNRIEWVPSHTHCSDTSENSIGDWQPHVLSEACKLMARVTSGHDSLISPQWFIPPPPSKEETQKVLLCPQSHASRMTENNCNQVLIIEAEGWGLYVDGSYLLWPQVGVQSMFLEVPKSHIKSHKTPSQTSSTLNGSLQHVSVPPNTQIKIEKQTNA